MPPVLLQPRCRAICFRHWTTRLVRVSDDRWRAGLSRTIRGRCAAMGTLPAGHQSRFAKGQAHRFSHECDKETDTSEVDDNVDMTCDDQTIYASSSTTGDAARSGLNNEKADP